VVQIAGTIVPADTRGKIMRSPTGSSTLPSLMRSTDVGDKPP
jgi:hypothetical protein